MDAKTVFCLLVLHRVCIEALPVNNDIENSSCIVMTPKRVKELKEISEDLNDFINKLTDKYEDIDFTFVEIKVENHRDDEEEEKETTLKISVKDCYRNSKDVHINEGRVFENSDVEPNSSKTTGIDVQNDNGDDNDINNDDIGIKNDNGEIKDTVNEDITDLEESINVKSQNERSKTINLNKTNENNVEQNINKIDEANKIRNQSKNILDSNLTHLSEESENEERGDLYDELNKIDIQQNTDNDQNSLIENVIKNIDKDINRDIGKSNIIIYAPNIDNTRIEIGSEYADYAVRSVLRTLAEKQLTKHHNFNPFEFYQKPIDNFVFFNNPAKNDFDLTEDATIKDNLHEFKGDVHSDTVEAQKPESEVHFVDPFFYW